jgi:hypothetical protein
MSMNGPILTHATEAELATAVSKNLHALFHAMQVLPGCKVVESDKLSYHHAVLTNRFFWLWATTMLCNRVSLLSGLKFSIPTVPPALFGLRRNWD